MRKVVLTALLTVTLAACGAAGNSDENGKRLKAETVSLPNGESVICVYEDLDYSALEVLDCLTP